MKRAFTLLELLITLTIISTVFLGLQTLLQTQIKYSDHTWRYREAIDLAASWLETRTYAQRLLTPSRNGYVVEEKIESPQTGQQEVTIYVRWSDGLMPDNEIQLSRKYYQETN